MNPAPLSDETLFAAALERPAAERAGYLDQACAGDVARRDRIERLLHANDASDFMVTPAAGVAPTVRVIARPEETAPGPHRPLQASPETRRGRLWRGLYGGAGGAGLFLPKQKRSINGSAGLQPGR